MARSVPPVYETLAMAPGLKALGVDEAGRGPVLGPLVMAGVLANSQQIEALEAVGVADSKRLSKKRRGELATEVRRIIPEFSIRVLEAATVDRYRERGHLDHLEVETTVSMVNELTPDWLVVDALGAGGTTHHRRLTQGIGQPDLHILAENGADAKYAVVSAASLLAKTVRDEVMLEIGETFGEVGSGYPSDSKTVRFLENWRDSGRPLPEFVRKSWATVERIWGPEQRRLF